MFYQDVPAPSTEVDLDIEIPEVMVVKVKYKLISFIEFDLQQILQAIISQR